MSPRTQDPGPFALTEIEQLNATLSHSRFLALLAHAGTTVHAVSEAGNSFGEFLFVTVAATLPHARAATAGAPERHTLTLWGLGYHEPRERWLTEEWRWYDAQLPKPDAAVLTKRDVLAQIEARRATCLAEAAGAEPPSGRGLAYSFFAELTDEDGALTELEDLEALGVDVEGLFDD